VLFYSHYDGQPVVAANWDSDPFEPVLRTDYIARGGRDVDFSSLAYPIDPELRVFARSTSDELSSRGYLALGEPQPGERLWAVFKAREAHLENFQE
jgi:acetylornithine deacetylase/succinyl-diaminopimelate desuccinylase-like protein